MLDRTTKVAARERKRRYRRRLKDGTVAVSILAMPPLVEPLPPVGAGVALRNTTTMIHRAGGIPPRGDSGADAAFCLCLVRCSSFRGNRRHNPAHASCHGTKARICLGLTIVVNRRRRATCSDAVEADSR